MPLPLSDCGHSVPASRTVDVAVVGAGIVGVAHALEAARRGLTVALFERGMLASGASVRNFGLILPLAAPSGPERTQATRSRQVWIKTAPVAGFWIDPAGAMVLAYEGDEKAVMHEFLAQAGARDYGCTWLEPDEVLRRSPSVRPAGLLGALWSAEAAVVDPGEALAKLTAFLARDFGVKVRFGTAVTDISVPYLVAGGAQWRASRVVICGGTDFETLYPGVFARSGLTRCKLQMMRTEPQPAGWTLGPILATGLSLGWYQTFATCPTLAELKQRIARSYPALSKWGVHVLVTQNEARELVIGDSHQYGREPDPFDRPEIDALILGRLASFLAPPSLEISRRWHGVYAQHETDATFVAAPEPEVRIVTGLGGSGMTRGFGLAQEVMAAWLGPATASRSFPGVDFAQTIQPAEAS